MRKELAEGSGPGCGKPWDSRNRRRLLTQPACWGVQGVFLKGGVSERRLIERVGKVFLPETS